MNKNLNKLFRSAALMLFICGCFACDEDPTSVVLKIDHSFCATVDLGEERIERLCCPGDSWAGDLSCHSKGLLVENAPGSFSALIKARGFEFISQSFAVSTGGRHEMDVSLEALDSFEANEDFVTGFGADEFELFKQMSHQVNTELGPTSVVKFYITDIGSVPKIYFQNTKKHPIHYDFARNVVGVDQTPAEFEQATYYGPDRSAMAGSIVLYSGAHTHVVTSPFAVTFFPSDDLNSSQVVLAHSLIEERLEFAPLSGRTNRIVYLPAGDFQENDAISRSRFYKLWDVLYSTRQDLYEGITEQILNPGLAFGTLKLMTPEQLESTVVSFKDILVLTRLPNELPIVGGTITEELQTPLAHVNVCARTRGTPNIALSGALGDPRVSGFIDKLVRFEVIDGSFSIEEATLEEANDFWNSRNPDSVVPAKDLEHQGLPGFDELSFDDSIFVGVKAANLAELFGLLGDQAPNGFAIPFFYYDNFMNEQVVSSELCDLARNDCIYEGRDLDVCDTALLLCRDSAGASNTFWQYADCLIEDQQFNSDTLIREAALDSLRYLIKHTEINEIFAAELNARVLEVFGTNKTRLRSSTNSEDLPDFSGAGLYNSVSAYATGEKSASNQVRKVWASVWSWRAFEERSFWNIDHMAVEMGVAVNQAFINEAANGVLITQNIADQAVAGMYVNVQLGEVAVTNPEGGALPEIFSIIPSPGGAIQTARLRYSSLSPNEPVLSDYEIEQLYEASYRVQNHFAGLYNKNPYGFALDLEFKFHGPGRNLFIKQARPYTWQ